MATSNLGDKCLYVYTEIVTMFTKQREHMDTKEQSFVYGIIRKHD